ncbi:sacsin N-terminal ATP-binding-like domain-containing protein [Rhizobium leguminosarum]|uniref:sacsin N-terminal ATP-binding-like domain-containing protein n=1 Tax=Rhizobium leguminosarum TaxID=384 RepID=UPI00103C9E13|nr:ATP-binding protein [Rhizobium leguminosarum]MBB4326556.1 hypothetical protein [Rhizobium leguminosarum]MBB4352154.1 hypothetical protein [Rhizobium leguminosarum]MBB4546802.1 hypothetical protein [Rhizobium leguminosarum]MBB4559141.1 hypothetical protein [Rhizobium leguminosarum]TBZ57818.1 ATP-binding protein [Rhizobium leguminosarum bv. viciae]
MEEAVGRASYGVSTPYSTRAIAQAFVASIFDREMDVTLRNSQAGSKRDDAMRELTKQAANLYSKRILRELIQNAFDAAAQSPEPRILLKYDQSEGFGTLYVANTGSGFTEDNVVAITNPALSNKLPGNFIGHKGLGFRSVELLSQDVQIYSKHDQASNVFDGFCFRFANPSDEEAWLADHGESVFASSVVGRAHRLQLPVPIQDDPHDIPPFAAAGFSTVVRLKLKDQLAGERVIEEISGLINESAPLVLFLEHLHSLTIEHVLKSGEVLRKVFTRASKNRRSSAFGQSMTVEEITVDKRRFLLARMAADEKAFKASVQAAVDRSDPVEKWLEWKGAPVVSIALPLSQDAKAGFFFAFLPMETRAPFNGCLDAPFHPDADRKGLSLDNPLNSYLLDCIADLSLALARTISSSDEPAAELAAAAVDCVAWFSDSQRMVDASIRALGDAGQIPLPAIRRPETRWSILGEVFDWDDEKFDLVDARLLSRVCNVPMLRRGLGEARMEAIREFVLSTDFGFEPETQTCAEWGTAVAASLAERRRKTSRDDWEKYYGDLARFDPAALAGMRGKPIFRLEDGELGNANSQETLFDREVFIDPDTDTSGSNKRSRKASTRFPPKSIAKRMHFADPSLRWPPAVTKALVAAGLATEFNVTRVIAGLGRLQGKRPMRQVAIAAIGWAFDTWKSHPTQEVEAALRSASLPIPCAGGLRKAQAAYFSHGWRDTRGAVMAEFCDAVAGLARAKPICEGLLPSWESWPLKDKGSAVDWTKFMTLLGVKDGLAVFHHKTLSMSQWEWEAIRSGRSEQQSLEQASGPYWQQAIRRPDVQLRFGYKSGAYTSENTLYILQMQADFAQMSDRAKRAYARLVIGAAADGLSKYFETSLRRTGGSYDNVRFPSPLLAFLREAAWIPVVVNEETIWQRPCDCWFASRQELPRFLPRIDRSIRDELESSQALRRSFSEQLGMKFWANRTTAVERLVVLGEILSRGLTEHELEVFRSAWRQAWLDWHDHEPRLSLQSPITMAIQQGGRLIAERIDANAPMAEPIFVGENAHPFLENLLLALGHRQISLPPGTAREAFDALGSAFPTQFVLIDDVKPKIIIDGQLFDSQSSHQRLIDEGKDWLAEIAVLVLEFNSTLTFRSTSRTRQAIYEDFRRLRLVQGEAIEVEINGLRGRLPYALDGVLPIPDAENPAIILQSPDGVLTWAKLSRLSRGLAAAIRRPPLAAAFQAVIYAISNLGLDPSGVVGPPDDDILARAFGQPEERITELRRSLRNSNRRLLDWLLPGLQARFGDAASARILDREHVIVDDEDIVAALSGVVNPDEVKGMIQKCREAESLNGFRRELGITLGALNEAIFALGASFRPLRFERQLRQQFDDFKEEARHELVARVRDSYWMAELSQIRLQDYGRARNLDWLTFDERWLDTNDELSEMEFNDRVTVLSAVALPAGSQGTSVSIDILRQTNRALISQNLDHLRQVISAWVAKAPIERSAKSVWSDKSEQVTREALASGIFDFVALAADDLPSALGHAGLWPVGMPKSLKLADLGLVEDDLDHQAAAERRRQEKEDVRKRSVVIGGASIRGGVQGDFEEIAKALRESLEDKAFRQRSGTAELKPIAENPQRNRGRGSTKERETDPVYLSDEQRNLIGFAGEFAAYHYLRRTVKNFADDHWISAFGRRYLALSPKQDDDGYDFHIPRSRGGLFFEVKAHTGDPGYVDLGRSQVAAATEHANERKGVWKILYVSFALNPSLISVHELGNPFSRENIGKYRPSGTQGVRLVVDRA